MRKCSFGLERVHSNRYSTPNNMRGCKLSSESMGKTMKMKLKKIEDIKTSRSEMEMYSYRSEEAGQAARSRQAEGTEPQFYKTHYKVLQGKLSEQRNIDFGKTQLFVRPHRKEEKKTVKPKLYYHSPNLEEKMTLYLNNLLNRSREEKLESKEPSVPNEEELSPPPRRPSCNTRNLFWQKMKKVVSHRREKMKEDPFLGRAQSFQL